MPKNDIDRIVRENLVLHLLDVFKVILGIPDCEVDTSDDLPLGKIQDTIEREPDFVKVMRQPNGERFILHIEFQTTNEKGILLRMQEYHALIQRKADLPIKHYVIYLGKRPSSMNAQMKSDRIFDGFILKNVSEYAPDVLLNSDIPEEIIMAVLGNFNRKKPVEVIGKILSRLVEVSDPVKLQKYIFQLTVLSRLRNLQKETIEQTKAMALAIDVDNDILYKKGMEKGTEKERLSLAKKLIEKGMNLNEIADITGLSIIQLKKL